jgi:hypothetical protein
MRSSSTRLATPRSSPAPDAPRPQGVDRRPLGLWTHSGGMPQLLPGALRSSVGFIRLQSPHVLDDPRDRSRNTRGEQRTL